MHYFRSFFAKHSWDVVEKIAQLRASPTSKFKLCFNLNGEYVFQDPKFVMQVVALLPRVDVLFGNRNEFEAFVSSSRRLGYKSPILNGIMSLFSRLKEPEIIQYDDLEGIDRDAISSDTNVVVTDGPEAVMTFRVEVQGSNGKSRVRGFRAVDSPTVEAAEIKDTIGAGDSFVAGYAQALMMPGGMKKKGEEQERVECVKRGVSWLFCYVAVAVIVVVVVPAIA